MSLGHNVFVFAGANGSYKDHEPFVFRYPSLPLPLAKIAAAIPVSAFVDQLLPALGLDVIHTHYPILLGRTAARKAAELNLPLVLTFHTQYWEYSQYEEYTQYIPFPQETIQEFLENTIDRWITEYLQKCQHVILPSESMKEVVVKKYGLKDRYSVIPTGTNLEAFLKAEGSSLRAEQGWQDELILISVGRLSPEKNWETLLRAFAKVHRDHRNARLVLIGDGPSRQSLGELADELGILERVVFTGGLPFEEVPRYLKAADAFAFASFTETQGLVTIEAMAAGQCDVGFANTYYLARLQAKDPKFPVAVFWPNQGDRGVHVNISGAGVTKHAKHPDHAIKLLEFLSSTEAFNQAPEALVGDPAALMSRSAFTSDGEWALYLTDQQETGGATLNMKPCGGGPSRTLPGVDTVAAAHQGRVVFSDNRSDPNMYPITAEAMCLDALNSMYEAGTAAFPILTILPRTPATSEMSAALGSAYTKFVCVSGISL